MKKIKSVHRLFYFGIVLISLSSCIGISADIQMRSNGSGRITLEYRFSRMAEAIGRLDGNERWNIIPTGRADIERTVARIDGLRLVSFSSREDSRDIINRVTLEFNNIETLIKFLDPTGSRASFSRQNGSNKLQLVLNEPVSSEINPDLLHLVQQVSEGYNVSFSFNAPGTSALTLTDGAGNPIDVPPHAEVVSANRRNVSLTIPTSEILRMTTGLGIIITYE